MTELYMGVVRREGDWRLEKVQEGEYEITFRGDRQAKVYTSDVNPDYLLGGGFDTAPVHEVDSYSEAVGLFEKKAHGPPPPGFSTGPGVFDSFSSGASETESVEGDLTPGMLAIALLLAGLFFTYAYWPSYNSRIFQVGVLLLVGGVAILGWAGFVFRRKGMSDALDFLFQTEGEKNDSGASASVDTTPPAPQKLKEEIIFDRADHHCEWCGQRFDGLQVHHIEPRNEGGPNTMRNLVALCSNCHDKADRGGISKTQLRGKVRRILAE